MLLIYKLETTRYARPPFKQLLLETDWVMMLPRCMVNTDGWFAGRPGTSIKGRGRAAALVLWLLPPKLCLKECVCFN